MPRKFVNLIWVVLLMGSTWACSPASAVPSTTPTAIPESPRVTSTPDSPAVGSTLLSESLATATPETLLGRPLIAVLDQDSEAVTLVDLTTQSSRRLNFGAGRPVNSVLGWLHEGCEPVIVLEYQTEDGFEDVVTRIDLQGNILQTLFSTRDYQGDGKVYQMFLSPSGDQLAYVVGQGDLGYSRYAVQNLEVVSLDNPTVSRRLTHSDGAWSVAWSPDGQRLAYTDYDAHQVEQLYVSKPDGAERIQLTHLADPDLTFDSLKWSPDGQRIAFRTRPRIVTSFKSSLGIVAVTAIVPPVYMQSIHGANIFWWPDAEMLMALALPESTGDDSTQEALFGFEADTGRVLNQRPRTEIPNQEMTFPEPLLPEQIGFFSGLDFYIYNLSTESFERQAEGVVLNILSWSPAPPAFAGEAECSK
jgi:hypothetical protein